jgi:hypothetical protein
MRYHLRTLLIAAAIGPPSIACCFWFVRHVMGMEDWKIVVSTIGLIAGFYFLRDAVTGEYSGEECT